MNYAQPRPDHTRQGGERRGAHGIQVNELKQITNLSVSENYPVKYTGRVGRGSSNPMDPKKFKRTHIAFKKRWEATRETGVGLMLLRDSH